MTSSIKSGYTPQFFFNTESPGPVNAKELFYQEKQSGGKCGIHAINAFAGKTITNPTDMLQKCQGIFSEIALELGGDT